NPAASLAPYRQEMQGAKRRGNRQRQRDNFHRCLHVQLALSHSRHELPIGLDFARRTEAAIGRIIYRQRSAPADTLEGRAAATDLRRTIQILRPYADKLHEDWRL